jgi:hypothetical protein
LPMPPFSVAILMPMATISILSDPLPQMFVKIRRRARRMRGELVQWTGSARNVESRAFEDKLDKLY